MSRFRKLGFAAALATALAAPAMAGKLGIGREATPQEVAAWDIDVRPDGQGLPKGRGTVAQGEEIFQAQCAACHGEFGEGKDRWPALAGGLGTLKADRPGQDGRLVLALPDDAVRLHPQSHAVRQCPVARAR